MLQLFASFAFIFCLLLHVVRRVLLLGTGDEEFLTGGPMGLLWFAFISYPIEQVKMIVGDIPLGEKDRQQIRGINPHLIM